MGLFIIFAFSVMSIFWTMVLRDIDPETFWGKIADYSVSFDNRFYDFRMKALLDPKFVSKDIAIVNIDDYSLQKIGTWPIPRTVHAKVLRKLKHFGVKVVGMDIMFPEKAPVCGGSSPDDVFAEALRD
ncbi:MAG: CHASE2 domain-containing protein, partial [Bdellovibrionales bacterium]|nr:CHASE2 domain-containing protein [Bdellovibrionales bacterium]